MRSVAACTHATVRTLGCSVLPSAALSAGVSCSGIVLSFLAAVGTAAFSLAFMLSLVALFGKVNPEHLEWQTPRRTTRRGACWAYQTRRTGAVKTGRTGKSQSALTARRLVWGISLACKVWPDTLRTQLSGCGGVDWKSAFNARAAPPAATRCSPPWTAGTVFSPLLADLMVPKVRRVVLGLVVNDLDVAEVVREVRVGVGVLDVDFGNRVPLGR